jgi:hypothetical protein
LAACSARFCTVTVPNRKKTLLNSEFIRPRWAWGILRAAG